jgi:hypothetical protein
MNRKNSYVHDISTEIICTDLRLGVKFLALLVQSLKGHLVLALAIGTVVGVITSHAS